MSEVKDGMCIIDAISGIDCATPQIGQFTDNFDKVKFLLGKDFNDYTMIIVTDINGHVEIVNTDGESLIKESADGETSLVWNIGANITSESGVVIYQIVAYKGNGESIDEVWYSKEGRLIVTESISTNEYSASLIGSYPNLLTRLLIDIDALQKELDTRCNQKVDVVEGMGLSQNSFSNEEKEKLSAIEEGAEVNVASDWQENDENSDSYIKNKPILASVALSGSYTDLKDKPIVDNAYNSESQNAQSGTAVAQAIAQLVNSSPEALNTLYELANALGNDPNFATTVAKQIGTKVDKIEGKELSSNDYTDAEKEKLASVQQGAERNVKPDWAEEDANSDKFIKNKPQLSEVALSGSYDDLTDKPFIPSVEGLASEKYVNTRLEGKADTAEFLSTKDDVGKIQNILYDNLTYGEWSNKRPIPGSESDLALVVASSEQIFSKSHYLTGGNLTVFAKTGYKVAFWIYDDAELQNKTFDSGYFQNKTFENITAGYYVFILRKDDYSDIYPKDADNVTVTVTSEFYDFRESQSDAQLYENNRAVYYPRFMSPSKCGIVMHRGANRLAPENSIPAFELAGENDKVFGIEADVRATSDGKYIIMHDATVDRTTNGSGEVVNMTFDEIRALTIDTGSNISQYPNLQVPTLEEYLITCKKYGKVAFIELEHNENNPETFVADIYRIIKRCGMEMSCIIMAFQFSYMEEVRKLTPHIPFAYIRDAEFNVNSNHGRIIGPNNCMNVDSSNTRLNSELVAKLHYCDCFVGVWCPPIAEFDKWAEMGVDFFTTDELPTVS